jgi:hypothetical protein
MILEECNVCINKIEQILPDLRAQTIQLENALIENFRLKNELYNE